MSIASWIAPFDGPRFPVTSVRDNVEAVHRLLGKALGVHHLRAIVGLSMGCQQAFQWAVLQAVPHAGQALGLLLVDFLHEVYVEPEKVNQLAGGVDFGLKRILALAQHGGRVDAGAIGPGQQVGQD